MADKKTILIVDDAPEIIDVASMFLEDKYKIITAGSKADGLKMYDEHKKDIALVVTDCDMPELRAGFELISDIRKRGGTTPIIMMTGRDHETRAAEVKQYPGDNDFIAKPFNPTELVAMIDKKLSGPQTAR